MPSLASRPEPRLLPLPQSLRAPVIAFAPPPRQNHLLNSLPDDVWERIGPQLELVKLSVGTCLLRETGLHVDSVYFPVNAIVSLVHLTANGASLQTAMIGIEGMVGVLIMMGPDKGSPVRATVQCAGYAYRLPARILMQEFEQSRAVMGLVLRYTQSLITQISQTAVCSQHHSLEQRLCRWLLSAIDGLASDKLMITQEQISNMIGVRREGVTKAIGKLQRDGVIRCTRNYITVVDRAALEYNACECYEIIERVGRCACIERPRRLPVT